VFSDSSLDQVFRYFDRDRDGLINYTEFLSVVLPQNDFELRTIASQRTPIEVEFLGYSVERAVRRILLKELELVEVNKLYSQDVKNCWNFSVSKAFEMLDYFTSNFIEAKGYFID
jgi:hypothetical protein